MVRIRLTSENAGYLTKAIVLNDELYDFCKEHTGIQKKESDRKLKNNVSMEKMMQDKEKKKRMSDGNTKVLGEKVTEVENEKQEIILINEETIQSKIYIVRGQKVMLDFELAEIYGYTTKRFNEQVKNNIERFDEDFRFQLLKEAFDNLRSKKSTSSWGGTRYLP